MVNECGKQLYCFVPLQEFSLHIQLLIKAIKRNIVIELPKPEIQLLDAIIPAIVNDEQ